MSNASDRAEVGRRLSRWRRTVLLMAPPSTKKVAIALAEFAWSSEDDPDGDLIVTHCTQEILRRLCDYRDARGLRVQLKKLEDAGWISRDDMQTGPGMFREYVLQVPATVRNAIIAELESPSPGMWRRLLAEKTERSEESDDPCLTNPEQHNTGTQIRPIEDSNADHRYSDSESPELQRNNTGTQIPNHRNSDAPLKEFSSISSSSSLAGSPPGGEPLSLTATDNNIPPSRKIRIRQLEEFGYGINEIVAMSNTSLSVVETVLAGGRS